jgi:hypothetical protein
LINVYIYILSNKKRKRSTYVIKIELISFHIMLDVWNWYMLNVPDEDYHRNFWTYLMKIITETFERTWWRLSQKPLKHLLLLFITQSAMTINKRIKELWYLVSFSRNDLREYYMLFSYQTIFSEAQPKGV